MPDGLKAKKKNRFKLLFLQNLHSEPPERDSDSITTAMNI